MIGVSRGRVHGACAPRACGLRSSTHEAYATVAALDVWQLLGCSLPCWTGTQFHGVNAGTTKFAISTEVSGTSSVACFSAMHAFTDSILSVPCAWKCSTKIRPGEVKT